MSFLLTFFASHSFNQLQYTRTHIGYIDEEGEEGVVADGGLIRHFLDTIVYPLDGSTVWIAQRCKLLPDKGGGLMEAAKKFYF